MGLTSQAALSTAQVEATIAKEDRRRDRFAAEHAHSQHMKIGTPLRADLVLPEEDSNLRPSDYPFPEISLGRGLSHHRDPLRSVGAGRLVSEPSRGVPRAWLRIALTFARFRFPAIHPVLTPEFPQKAATMVDSRLLYQLSYRGSPGQFTGCER